MHRKRGMTWCGSASSTGNAAHPKGKPRPSICITARVAGLRSAAAVTLLPYCRRDALSRGLPSQTLAARCARRSRHQPTESWPTLCRTADCSCSARSRRAPGRRAHPRAVKEGPASLPWTVRRPPQRELREPRRWSVSHRIARNSEPLRASCWALGAAPAGQKASLQQRLLNPRRDSGRLDGAITCAQMAGTGAPLDRRARRIHGSFSILAMLPTADACPADGRRARQRAGERGVVISGGGSSHTYLRARHWPLALSTSE
eukprot:scaffold12362_cov124-Isochrysis_galbana.AAC.10